MRALSSKEFFACIISVGFLAAASSCGPVRPEGYRAVQFALGPGLEQDRLGYLTLPAAYSCEVPNLFMTVLGPGIDPPQKMRVPGAKADFLSLSDETLASGTEVLGAEPFEAFVKKGSPRHFILSGIAYGGCSNSTGAAYLVSGGRRDVDISDAMDLSLGSIVSQDHFGFLPENLALVTDYANTSHFKLLAPTWANDTNLSGAMDAWVEVEDRTLGLPMVGAFTFIDAGSSMSQFQVGDFLIGPLHPLHYYTMKIKIQKSGPTYECLKFDFRAVGNTSTGGPVQGITLDAATFGSC